jgi:transcriptional regulator with GAF, ATPase, and Fis domain
VLAYLVIREGNKWSDVFRLIPGRTITVGRAPTNNIVIKEEPASRHHAEIFMTQGQWTVRDLDSRNGTMLGTERVHGDHPLVPGDVIRIARTQLAFVNDLATAYADSNSIPRPVADEAVGTQTVETVNLTDSSVLEPLEPTTITHRRHQTKLLKPNQDDEVRAYPKLGQAATKLCRLAFDLANVQDMHEIANLAINTLFDGTNVDAGAVLLTPRDSMAPADAEGLEIVASRTDSKSSYHRVSGYLAGTVLREGEAVLARNVEGDSALGIRDSKGEFQATSVICAPIRQDRNRIGLIHLYSCSSERGLDPDDLEFTLAVADNVALALTSIERQQSLVENLTLSRAELDQLRKRLGVESEIIGSSAQMMQVHEEVSRAAPSRATVLIRGESGVGKELVARAVHYSSPRKSAPFVCLNCAALSEGLLESELFGHEKGAFTGATDRKIGKFEAADNGTLMLDEIGEMSPSIQAKFLRVLEGHPFERVGGSKAIKVDARVIAATNRDLEKAVTEGKFRRDLFFRLHVIEIDVPPLRKRPQDIIELAEHFLQRFNAETGRKFRGFMPSAIQQMRTYRWPGNVRELKNVIERAVVLAQGNFIEAEDLSVTNISTASESAVVLPSRHGFEPMTLAEIERRHIIATLNATGWNKSRASSILGIERSTLDRKIRRYELGPKPPPKFA